MVNSEKMGFVYRVLWILKALWVVLSETFKVLGGGGGGCPWEFYHRFMYISPSSDHSLLIFILSFKVIVSRVFEVVLWCLEWECSTFQKTDENSFKSTNTTLWLILALYICMKNCRSMSMLDGYDSVRWGGTMILQCSCLFLLSQPKMSYCQLFGTSICMLQVT